MFGDSNIGSTKKFDKMNQYLNTKFVDALDLNCNRGVNKNSETTFMFRDLKHEQATKLGRICYERFDRVLATRYEDNKEKIKSVMIVEVEVWDEVLESCRGNKRLSKEEVLLREKFPQYMMLSDHSFLTGRFGSAA